MIDNKLQIQEEFLKNNLDKNSLRCKIREKINVILTEWIHNCLPDICDEIVDCVLNEITIKEEKENRDLIDYTLRFDKSYIESLIPGAVIFEGIASEKPDIFGTSRSGLIASGELEVLDILPNYQALGYDRALKIETSDYRTIVLFVNSPGTNKVQRYLTTNYSDKLSYKDYLDIVDKITEHIISYNGLKI
jgi:hypothetical protein